MKEQQPMPKDERRHSMEDSSPVNMLGGLILALLTLILVLICIMAVNILAKAKENTPEDPGTEDPGTEDPGTDDPGTDDPGTDDPGTEDPGTDDPGKDDPGKDDPGTEDPGKEDPSQPTKKSYVITRGSETVEVNAAEVKVNASDFLLIDADEMKMVATFGSIGADVLMEPAGLTKLMTLLVVSEKLTDAKRGEYVLVSEDSVKAVTEAGSTTCLRANDELKVDDLVYALALAEDDVAALQLAQIIAGSEEAFVALMNEKCREIELIQTNFVNCTGRTAEGQVTTCRELASIMAYAMDNAAVKKLLTTEYYKTTTKLCPEPEGLTFASSFYDGVNSWREVPNAQVQPSNGTITAAYLSTESDTYSLISQMKSTSGKTYICIALNSGGFLSTLIDYRYIYEKYAE